MKRETKTYTMFNDPGHGWLRVPLGDIDIELDISRFSYKDDKYGYLEEDRDMAIFLKSIGDGQEIKIVDVYENEDSFIRDLDSFRS